MAGARAPKQWSLSKNETITSFESWRQNLLYTLSLDNALYQIPRQRAPSGKRKTADCPTRSFIGAYKVLSRVVKGAAYHVSPLDAACAGRESSEVIVWTDELSAAFHRAQSALRDHRAVVLPRPSDDLWIVTDGSSKLRGIGATLYVTRHGRTMLAGFFSAQLRKHQNDWLPCEIEALAIAAAVKHYAPYIIQASSNVCLLTDSKPCVQAIGKLGRGEFSASPRVSTFLSTISRYRMSVRHLAGSANLPSDFFE